MDGDDAKPKKRFFNSLNMDDIDAEVESLVEQSQDNKAETIHGGRVAATALECGGVSSIRLSRTMAQINLRLFVCLFKRWSIAARPDRQSTDAARSSNRQFQLTKRSQHIHNKRKH